MENFVNLRKQKSPKGYNFLGNPVPSFLKDRINDFFYKDDIGISVA